MTAPYSRTDVPSVLADHERRIGILEAHPRAARFEIVSDITFPVPFGICADMIIARDMDQMHLIDAAAWCYVAPQANVEVTFRSDSYTDFLNSPIVIPAFQASSYPTLPDIVPEQPMAMGDRVYIDVLDPGTDGLGLGIVLIYA